MLISASALGVMIRYLDQVNITSAFSMLISIRFYLVSVSDMGYRQLDERRSFTYGKELNDANAIWSAAYVVGQIPSNQIFTRVNIPLYIAFMEAAWTVFTFAHVGIRNTKLYVFRFLYVFKKIHYPIASHRPLTGLQCRFIRSWPFPRSHVRCFKLRQTP
jgi:ACS family pantothenate transporter-like MFS transporter